MQVVRVQEVPFTIASGATSGTGTLSGFTNLAKIVPIATWRVADGMSPVLASMCDINIEITNLTTITATRYGSQAFAVIIRAYVVELGDDTVVYKVPWAMTASETSKQVSIGATVPLANTYGWHYRKSNDTGAPTNDSIPNARLTSLHFDSTSTVQINRTASGYACDGTVYIVSSPTLAVTHGTYQPGSVSTVETTATIATVNLSTTFLCVSYQTDETVYNDEGCWAADLSNATTLRFRRGYAAAGISIWRYMLVSDPAISVQRGVMTGTATAENNTITAVDLSRSFVKSTDWRSGINSSSDYTNGNMDGRYNELWLGSSSQVNRQTGDGVAGLICPWEVVQLAQSTPPSARRRLISVA